MLVAAGGGVVSTVSGGGLSLEMIVIAPGMMVMSIIYFMGTVSGAHLNPAVTLAFAVRGNFSWRRVPGYVFSQLVGGITAAVFLRAMFGNVGLLGATVPGARNIGTNGALAVGVYIALAGLWAAPIGGASMNPVRSFAPDLVRGDLRTSWVYIVGPILGALMAVCFEWILRGKPSAKRRNEPFAVHEGKFHILQGLAARIVT